MIWETLIGFKDQVLIQTIKSNTYVFPPFKGMFPSLCVCFRIFFRTSMIHRTEIQEYSKKIASSQTCCSTLSPWHTSGSSSLQLSRTYSGRSCTCEQFLAPMDHQGLGPSTKNRSKATPRKSIKNPFSTLKNLRESIQGSDQCTSKMKNHAS